MSPYNRSKLKLCIISILMAYNAYANIFSWFTGSVGDDGNPNTQGNGAYAKLKESVPLSQQLPSAPALVTLEVVEIGNPGNKPDTTGYGAVAYVYQIGKYDVTVGQYLAFLNAKARVTSQPAIVELWNSDMQQPAKYVAPGFIRRTGSGTSADPYIYSEIPDTNLGAKSSMRGMPNISWFSAARFANWMHNGATADSDTETGAYTLNYARDGVFTKNPGAKWWIPTENEWYKAAYYDPTLNGGSGGYYKYPTKSNLLPLKSAPSSESNAANYDGALPNLAKITPVGAYVNASSYYGTFDQGGLLWQWNDAVYNDHDGKALTRGMRGGSWSLGLINISKYGQRDYPPTYNDDDSGFRLATVKH